MVLDWLHPADIFLSVKKYGDFIEFATEKGSNKIKIASEQPNGVDLTIHGVLLDSGVEKVTVVIIETRVTLLLQSRWGIMLPRLYLSIQKMHRNLKLRWGTKRAAM